MMVLRCASSFEDMHKLVEKAALFDGVLLLSPKAVRTAIALEAAFRLAADAFSGGSNISSKLQNETMLFLACEINFESALRKIGAADPSDFIFVSEGKIPQKNLVKKLKLTRCQALALTKMGERKGGYFEGERAVERMALARIKN